MKTTSSLVAFPIVLSLLWLGIIACRALPDGFVSEIVSPNTKAVMGVFAPNPRRDDLRPMMLVISKNGRVRVLENPENLPDETKGTVTTKEDLPDGDANIVLDLSNDICTNGERGLTSIAVHPRFSETNWVYLYYNQLREGCREDVVEGPQNALVRYTMNATTLALEDARVLLQTGFLGERVHNGGAMEFGTDGYLYLATGDGGVRKNVQDRTNLHGSLLRLKDDGSIPRDNPYAQTGVRCGTTNGVVVVSNNNSNSNSTASVEKSESKYCSEIYAWGFRNPIRMAVHPEKSTADRVLFSISDVGAQQFEELNWAGTDYKEKNYGWPTMEGPCVTNTIDDCPVDSALVDPYHYYVHTSYENGGCVVGSTFVPEGIWPEEYKYLFIDFIYLKIYNLVEDFDAECRDTCFPPISGYRNSTFYESIQEKDQNINEARMVDLFFGPYKDTQALYVIKYGNSNPILRIRYVGPAPIASIEIIKEGKNTGSFVLPTSGGPKKEPAPVFAVGQKIEFDASASFDPEGDPLALLEWDFGDNGKSSSTSRTSHIYEQPGDYIVALTVTESDGQSAQAFKSISVQNGPTVSILSPREGDGFAVGDVLRLEGETYDNKGMSIPNNRLAWEVRFYQSGDDDSVVFLKETNEKSVDLEPFPYDLAATEKSFLSIILRATDEEGLTTTTERILQPNIVDFGVFSEPKGLQLIVDNNVVVAPARVPAWVGVELPLDISTDQAPYKFQRWSDGVVDASRVFRIGTNNTNADTPSVTAIFCLVENASCSDDSTVGCCSGYCDGKGVCRNETSSFQTEQGTLGPTVVGTAWDSKDEFEPDRKPTIPDSADPKVEMADVDQANSIPDTETSQEDEMRYGLGPMGKSILAICVLLLLVAPCYLGWKYYNLKNKMEAESKISSAKEFDDPALTPRTMAATPSEEEDCTEAMVDVSDAMMETNTSNISCFSTGTIWDRIAEETERRAKLRAKYSSLSGQTVGTPGTPQTAEDRNTPSTEDSARSPSSVLTNNMEENLERLDDLLSSIFSRKPTRSSRKQEQRPDEHQTQGDRTMESGDANSEDEEPSEQSYLASLWMSTTQNTMPGSPLRDDMNEGNGVDANMSMASVYTTGSIQGDITASRVKLSEISDTSLLLFHDNDLSMSTSEVVIDRNDASDDNRMESGMA